MLDQRTGHRRRWGFVLGRHTGVQLPIFHVFGLGLELVLESVLQVSFVVKVSELGLIWNQFCTQFYG